jgi:integrase
VVDASGAVLWVREPPRVDAGVPTFSPHDLRRRRITLLLKHGELSWQRSASSSGQRSRVVTLDTYAHVLLDHREVDRAL